MKIFHQTIGPSIALPLSSVSRGAEASLALNIGQALIMQRDDIQTIEELVEVATTCRAMYPWKG